MRTRTERWARTRIRVSPGAVGEPCRLRSSMSASDVAAPSIRAMLLSRTPEAVAVSLVPEGALILAGDGIELDVTVDAGAGLDLVEPGGTVAFDMRGGAAAWQVRIRLGEDARLTWAGEPLVISSGADLARRTEIHLAAGARMALRESVVLGRHGESPGRVALTTRVTDADGPLLVEDLDLGPGTARSLLGGHRVLTSVLSLGPIPCPAGDPDRFDLDRFDLDRGGTLWRRLGAQSHEADLPAAWTSACRVASGIRA